MARQVTLGLWMVSRIVVLLLLTTPASNALAPPGC